MKISDMTDMLFDKEMQRVLGDVQFWCMRLDQIGGFSLKPIPVSYMDDKGMQPFPLALELKEVWDYAKGDSPKPEDMQSTIQSLCELLWSSIGGNSYDIPYYWWDEPLGFMCKLAWARSALEAGEYLNAEQLSALGDLTPQRVKQLCRSGDIPTRKAEQARNSQQEWAIAADVARAWLESRK